jgi:hypothetical protein
LLAYYSTGQNYQIPERCQCVFILSLFLLSAALGSFRNGVASLPVADFRHFLAMLDDELLVLDELVLELLYKRLTLVAGNR